MENASGGAGFLTIAVVVIALVLPGLVLMEMWRSRRVALADDAPDTVLDPVLSGAGMSRKILLAMVVIVEAMLLFVAYGANEPFRQASARERQKEFAIEAGAHTYVQYCVACHGVSGKGYLENEHLAVDRCGRAQGEREDDLPDRANRSEQWRDAGVGR